jgi:hypothetical protein
MPEGGLLEYITTSAGEVGLYLRSPLANSE